MNSFWRKHNTMDRRKCYLLFRHFPIKQAQFRGCWWILSFPKDTKFNALAEELVVFIIFHSWAFYRAKRLKAEKTQNTISVYKKESKIQSDKIFWCAIPKLWVVSFVIFDSWPLYQAKSGKMQNTIFGYKKGQKIQSDKIFPSTTPKLWIVSFANFN